jgi:hypothetical protein
LYIKKQVETTPTEIKAAVEQVPLEIKPMQDFVTSCVEQTGEQGIRKLGSQGGYIDVSKFKVNLANPTEGDAVSFGGMVVPYWYYMKMPNKCPDGCAPGSKIPALRGASTDSFESQISSYVDANLKDCLEGFARFKQEGFDIAEVSDVKTTTTIGDNNVYVGVSYTIDATKDTVKQRMTQYAASLPVNLKRIYSLANEIIELDQNYTYFERATMDMITAYSGLNINQMPPFSDIEFRAAPTVPSWPVASAAENFKAALGANVARFQIMGTENYKRQTYPGTFIQSLSDNYIIGPMKSSYSSLSASFAYLGWPIYFKINNGASSVKPKSFGVPMLFNMITYNSVYDISYPIVIQLEDKKAFNNQGFSFNIALESNVRQNEPLKTNYVQYSMPSSGAPLLCNENQRLSGNITVTATEMLTNAKLDGVQVVFNCGETSCSMGTTGSNGKLVTKFPLCIGGSMSYFKDGYFAKSNPFSTSLGRSKSIQAEIYKKVKMNVTVMKKRITIRLNITVLSPVVSPKVKRIYWFDPTPVPIQENEMAIITFSRVPEFGEEDLTQVVIFSNETKFAEIEIVPGNYEVTGSLILNSKVIIPKDQCYKCTGGTWYNFGSCDCMEVAEIVMEKLPRGGLTFDKPELYWKVVNQELVGNRNLDVYVISTLDGFGINNDSTTTPMLKVDDLNQLGKTDEYSMKYRMELEPDFR